jgi:hypothetical protein
MQVGKGDFPISYFVLCLDNLDQSPPEVIKAAIAICDRWIKEGNKIWKIFIPLWPSTYRHLYRTMDPFPKKAPKVYVGQIDSDALLGTRIATMARSVQESGASAKCFDETLSTTTELQNAEVLEYIRLSLKEVKGHFLNTVRSLSGGSMTRQLCLLETTLLSRSLEHHYVRAYPTRETRIRPSNHI